MLKNQNFLIFNSSVILLINKSLINKTKVHTKIAHHINQCKSIFVTIH